MADSTNISKHVDLNSCTICPGGSYMVETEETEREKKRITHDSVEDCTICPSGKINTDPGLDVDKHNSLDDCVQCGVGTYLADDGYDYLLHDTDTDCTQCPRGKISQALGATSDCECLKCDAGLFSNVRGATECKTCAAMTYQEESGGQICKDCAEGTESQPGSVICSTWDTFVGLPYLPQMIEDNLFSYELSLTKAPISATVVMNLSSSNEQCQVPPLQYTFDESNWNQKIEIVVSILNGAVSTAKGSELEPGCRIRHHVYTADEIYSNRTHEDVNIRLFSKGCGIGEYRGKWPRKTENECICSVRFYKPPSTDCLDCVEGMVCNSAGVETPEVAPGYWRHTPESHDFETYKLYECLLPSSCTGGNRTQGRCAAGYADDSALCAVCADGYVMQQGLCSYCPEYKPSAPTMPTGDLLIAGIISLLLFACCLYFFLTQNALSPEDEFLLREKLSHVNLDTVFVGGQKDADGNIGLTFEAFSAIIEEEEAGFTVEETQHIFQIIDTNDNDFISRQEVESYISNDGELDPEDLSKIAQQKQMAKQDKGDSERQVGNTVMKLKIFFGFTQCMSGAAVVYDIPWPPFLTKLMKLMELTSFDIYAVFGEMSCTMQTGFTQKFVFHMMLGPMLGISIYMVWKIILLRKKYCTRCRPNFTQESMRTNLYTLMQLMAFGLYTGLATRIFRLFKCHKVHDKYFLTGDYSFICFEGDWWTYGTVAIVCIVVYIIGIPLVQFVALYSNREHLHHLTALDLRRHRKVVKQFGSIYRNYTVDCYYYDLVDLLRRLMLTGGLILVGEESTAQIFLGTVICVVWLLLIAFHRPYKAYYDNVLGTMLSANLMLTMICGLCLKMYALERTDDAYEQIVFDYLLSTIAIMSMVIGVLALIVAIPQLRVCIMGRVMSANKNNIRKHFDEWKIHQMGKIKWLQKEALDTILKKATLDIETAVQNASKHKRLLHNMGNNVDLVKRYERLNRVQGYYAIFNNDPSVKKYFLCEKRRELYSEHKCELFDSSSGIVLDESADEKSYAPVTNVHALVVKRRVQTVKKRGCCMCCKKDQATRMLQQLEKMKKDKLKFVKQIKKQRKQHRKKMSHSGKSKIVPESVQVNRNGKIEHECPGLKPLVLKLNELKDNIKATQFKLEEIRQQQWEEVEMLVDEVWLRRQVTVGRGTETKMIRTISLQEGYVVGITTKIDGERETVYFDNRHFTETNINVMLSFFEKKKNPMFLSIVDSAHKYGGMQKRFLKKRKQKKKFSLSKVTPAGVTLSKTLMHKNGKRKYFGWLSKKKRVSNGLETKEANEVIQPAQSQELVRSQETKASDSENNATKIKISETPVATAANVQEEKGESGEVSPETEAGTEYVVVNPRHYTDGYFAVLGVGGASFSLCKGRSLGGPEQGYEMYDTVRGVVIKAPVHQYFEIKDVDSVSERYITTFSVKRTIAVKVIFNKQYFSKDELDAMVSEISLIEAEKDEEQKKIRTAAEEALAVKKQEEMERKQKLEEMKREQILNQNNIQGYYAKFMSPYHYLCQYRMKQGSHKKYEMYNMHYGTVEDVDMSKSDHGFVGVKDVKPLSFKRGFVKSFSHNPIGIKVMYDRKFFTADQLQAMKVFMTKYETKK